MKINLEVNPSEEQLKQIATELKAEIIESLKLEYIAVDKATLLKLMPYGETFLQEEFLSHPSVQVHQRRKGERGKLVWIYEPTRKAILDIMDSWN